MIHEQQVGPEWMDRMKESERVAYEGRGPSKGNGGGAASKVRRPEGCGERKTREGSISRVTVFNFF